MPDKTSRQSAAPCPCEIWMATEFIPFARFPIKAAARPKNPAAHPEGVVAPVRSTSPCAPIAPIRFLPDGRVRAGECARPAFIPLRNLIPGFLQQEIERYGPRDKKATVGCIGSIGAPVNLPVAQTTKR